MRSLPRQSGRVIAGGGAPAPIELALPFAGRWLVQNSPANRVPSHGTARFATAHAIDFVPLPPDARRGPRTAPFTLRSLLRPEPPERFPGFGRPVLAPAEGIVVAAHDGMPDHDAHRGLPSIGYVLSQPRRAAEGWTALAGNHVLLDCGPALVALCHLRRGSIAVGPGEQVRVGDRLGACGNSGNSTEPHLHLQALDGPDPARAAAVPMRFAGAMPRNGEIVDAG